MELRPYQKEAVAVTLQDREENPQGSGVLYLATGTGKTVIATHISQAIGGSVLFLVHREELVEQAMNKFNESCPSASIGVVKAKKNEIGKQITIAGIDTLRSSKRIEQLPTEYDVIFCDEGHHAGSLSWTRVLQHFKGYKIALTATPERKDKKRLDHIFSKILYRYTIGDGIKDGYLCDLEGKRFILEGVDLDTVKVRVGDFNTSELAQKMMQENVIESVCDNWVSEAEKLKTLFFCVNIEHSQLIAYELGSRGYAADWISGDMALDIRKRKLNDFRTGAIQILANCQVLSEGYDEPSIQCIAMARPTLSQPLYIQQVGRGTRLYPGKEKCKVLDFVGNSKRHSISQLGILTGYNPSPSKKSRKSGNATFGGGYIPSLKDLILKQEEIDLLGYDPYQVKCEWLLIDDKWVLSAGWGFDNGFIVIAGQEPNIKVTHHLRIGYKFEQISFAQHYYQSLDQAKQDAVKTLLKNFPDTRKLYNQAINLNPVTKSQMDFILKYQRNLPTTYREAQKAITSILWHRWCENILPATSHTEGKQILKVLQNAKRLGYLQCDLSFADIERLKYGEAKQLVSPLWRNTHMQPICQKIINKKQVKDNLRL